uniref:tRNA amidotransferase n=1 Tax=Pseudomonas phage HRDY3 TaxID=3236930 RepID=A0AB39CE68_9VIRU
MTLSILQQLTVDRDTARLQSPKETYPILTRILGDYELGTKAKKPKVGDDALVLIIKGILAGNAETIALLKKSQGGEQEHAGEILRLENQTRLLQKYIPAKAEKEQSDNPDVLTEQDYRAILAENPFDKLGLFHKFLKENYAGRTEGAVATRVFNAVQKEKAAE